MYKGLQSQKICVWGKWHQDIKTSHCAKINTRCSTDCRQFKELLTFYKNLSATQGQTLLLSYLSCRKEESLTYKKQILLIVFLLVVMTYIDWKYKVKLYLRLSLTFKNNLIFELVLIVFFSMPRSFVLAHLLCKTLNQTPGNSNDASNAKDLHVSPTVFRNLLPEWDQLL